MMVGTGEGQSQGFDTVVTIRHIGTMQDEQMLPILVKVGQWVSNWLEVGVGSTVGIGDTGYRSSMAAADVPLFHVSLCSMRDWDKCFPIR